MITIDGSIGEGGGQVVRNACALSLITGKPFSITKLRGGRAKPGLMRQHLTAVEAACAIGNAHCTGATVGSQDLTFYPGAVEGGDYHFSIGTAGSTGLVLQTILMPLILANKPSRVVIEGGTHAKMAPPFDFISRCFLPLINSMGPTVSASIDRYGFFPRGGGRIEIDITPAPLKPFHFMDRGALQAVRATALTAGLESHIGERELKVAQSLLSWPDESCTEVTLHQKQGPGNAVLLEVVFDHGLQMTSAFAERNMSAERVAAIAATEMVEYLASDAFAGEHLQDQLLLPLVLAGKGSFTCTTPSQHTKTAIEGIEAFTGKKIAIAQANERTYHVSL